MKLVALDVQGFNVLYDNGAVEFHAKEITISNSLQASHYLLKPKVQFSTLTRYNKKEVIKAEMDHGLRYSSGYIEYNLIAEILDRVLSDCDVLYIKGKHAARFVQDSATTSHFKIVDIDTLNVWHKPSFKDQKPSCLDHIDCNSKVQCSKTNCFEIITWLKEFIP